MFLLSVTEDEAKFFLNNKESVDFEEFFNNCWSIVKPYILMNAAEYKPATDLKEDATEAGDLQDDGEEQEDESKGSFYFVIYKEISKYS